MAQPINEGWVAGLEDYTPTIPDSLIVGYLMSSGFKTDDPRVVRLISLAAQKFISEVAMDAVQHSKRRGTSQSSRKGGKDRKLILTLEDLAPALHEFGITIKKPSYYT
jgi:transcription initiation factor TFIID subunit 10